MMIHIWTDDGATILRWCPLPCPTCPLAAQQQLESQRQLHLALHNQMPSPPHMMQQGETPRFCRGPYSFFWGIPPSVWWFNQQPADVEEGSLLEVFHQLYGGGPYLRGTQTTPGHWDISLPFRDNCLQLLGHLHTLLEAPAWLGAEAAGAPVPLNYQGAEAWQGFTQPTCVLHHQLDRVVVTPACMPSQQDKRRLRDGYTQDVWLGNWKRRARDAGLEHHPGPYKSAAHRLLLWLLIGPPPKLEEQSPQVFSYEGLQADLQEGAKLMGEWWGNTRGLECVEQLPSVLSGWATSQVGQDKRRVAAQWDQQGRKKWEASGCWEWSAMHLCVGCPSCLNPLHLAWGLVGENNKYSYRGHRGTLEPCWRALAHRNRVLAQQGWQLGGHGG